MDELERLPHGWRDALGSKCAAVDDLKHLVVQVCEKVSMGSLLTESMTVRTVELVLKRDCDHWHENSLEVQQDVRRAL